MSASIQASRRRSRPSTAPSSRAAKEQISTHIHLAPLKQQGNVRAKSAGGAEGSRRRMRPVWAKGPSSAVYLFVNGIPVCRRRLEKVLGVEKLEQYQASSFIPDATSSPHLLKPYRQQSFVKDALQAESQKVRHAVISMEDRLLASAEDHVRYPPTMQGVSGHKLPERITRYPGLPTSSLLPPRRPSSSSACMMMGRRGRGIELQHLHHTESSSKKAVQGGRGGRGKAHRPFSAPAATKSRGSAEKSLTEERLDELYMRVINNNQSNIQQQQQQPQQAVSRRSGGSTSQQDNRGERRSSNNNNSKPTKLLQFQQRKSLASAYPIPVSLFQYLRRRDEEQVDPSITSLFDRDQSLRQRQEELADHHVSSTELLREYHRQIQELPPGAICPPTRTLAWQVSESLVEGADDGKDKVEEEEEAGRREEQEGYRNFKYRFDE